MAWTPASQLPRPPVLDSAALDRASTIQGVVGLAADTNVAPDDAVHPFWPRPEPDLTRWDKYFPYQLLVLRAEVGPDGKTTHHPEPGWSYTFPIAPEGVTVTGPFGITTQLTLDGVDEQHNGLPIRTIVVHGTLGVLPGRGSAQQQGTPSFVGAVLGGTIGALGRLAGDAAATARSALNTTAEVPNVHPESDFAHSANEAGSTARLPKTSGYYQYLRLTAFLEAYAAAKMLRANRDLRLALCVWKEKAVWLVTPQVFEPRKQAGSPLEYGYSLSMKAWRRIVLEAGNRRQVDVPPIRRDPSDLARILNTLRGARRVLADVGPVLSAVADDFDHAVLEPMREEILVCKDALNVATTVADLPAVLRAELAEPWAKTQSDAASVGTAASALSAAVRADLRSAQAGARRATSISGGLTAGDPATNLFGPNASLDTTDSVEVASIPLTPALRRRIGLETSRVRNLRRHDFAVRLDGARRASALLAFALGAGDADYAAQFGAPSVTRVKDEPSPADWRALRALDEVVASFAALAAAQDGEPAAGPTSVDVMAQLARRSGIAFRVPTAKYAVPYPYGSTIEDVAQLYLGSRERAPELIALNGLRPPYVDEVGFSLPLRVNASGDEVVVAPDDRLYVGQPVWTASNVVGRSRRRIVGLRRVGPDLVVKLDGAADLDRYLANDGAALQSFLPDTVNSQGMVYISTDQAAADDPVVDRAIPGVDAFDPMVSVGGVDLLLTQDNDLVLSPDGQERLAIGLANIVQGLRVDFTTKRGTVPGHADIGLPLAVGDPASGASATEVRDAARRMVSEDPAFQGIDGLRVTREDGATRVDVAPVLVGTGQPIPVTFRTAT